MCLQKWIWWTIVQQKRYTIHLLFTTSKFWFQRAEVRGGVYVCMYVCVYMYVCMYVCVYIYIYVCVYVHVYVYMRPRACIHTNVFLRFCIVSSNELVVLDSFGNSKQCKTRENVSVCTGALSSLSCAVWQGLKSSVLRYKYKLVCLAEQNLDLARHLSPSGKRA